MWLSDCQIGGEDDNLRAVSSVSSSICPQCFEVQVWETNAIEQPSHTAASNWGLLLQNLNFMQLDASLVNFMPSPFPKKNYNLLCMCIITDTVSVECLYFIALPSSYLYCVVLMLFQEIWGRGGRMGYSAADVWNNCGICGKSTKIGVYDV